MGTVTEFRPVKTYWPASLLHCFLMQSQTKENWQLQSNRIT